MRQRRAFPGISIAGILALLIALAGESSAATGATNQPGPGEVGVNFIKFACPTAPANPYSDCDIVTGATFRIEQDGVEIPGSPFTTGPTGLLPGFFFDVADSGTLTITELGGGPAGFVPAPGFAPLIIEVAAIPIGGCGGESTCPTIEFINVAVPAVSEPTVAPTVDVAPTSTPIPPEAPPMEALATNTVAPPPPVATLASTVSLEGDGRAATIFAGDCGGRFVDGFPVFTNLVDLVPAGGASVGGPVDAVPETSFTTVLAPFDVLVAEPHLIAISALDDENQLVACGDIAGLLMERGDLVVPLRELNDSGFAGVAYLSPDPSTEQTGVSVFLVEGLADTGTPTAG